MNTNNMRVVYSEEAIQKRVREMAAEIDATYGTEPFVVICVLKGAVMFFSDLVRAMKSPVEIDFVRLASYGNKTTSSKNVSFTKDVEISLKDKHVLVVEDIIDTGHTIDFLMKQLRARGTKSLRIAALLDKLERRETEVKADFVGFDLTQGFIVGYGLDYAEQFRGLPAIYEILD